MREQSLEDEPKTIEYLLTHLEELFVRQNDLQLSPQSVPVYIGRIRTVCNDYKTYGTDGSSIYRWNRTIRKRKEKTPETKVSSGTESTKPNETQDTDFGSTSGQTPTGTKLNIVS